MKNILLRLIRLTTVMVLVLSLAPRAAAADDAIYQDTADNARRLLASVYFDDCVEYGIPGDAYNDPDFALGPQIPTYELADDQLTPTESCCFPLYYQNELVSLISSFYVGDTLESSIESAEDISSLLDPTRAFAFVYARDGLYMARADGLFLLREYAPDESRSEITSEATEPLLAQLISSLSPADSSLTKLEGIDTLIGELLAPQEETPDPTPTPSAAAADSGNDSVIVLGVLLGVIALTAAAVGIYCISNRTKRS